MNICEFVNAYNLHDSLLEKVEYNAEEKSVKLTVDFCYWQQKNFRDGMKETGLIIIEFMDVSEFVFSPYAIHSDEIINAEMHGEFLSLTMSSDLLDNYQKISIHAREVKITCCA